MTNVKETILEINSSDQRLVLIISGAGIQAAKWLLDVPGASKTILEIQIPYSDKAMHELLEYTPTNFVSESTVLDMAKKAYEKAIALRSNNEPLLGIACTAAISTDRDRRGKNHAYICSWSAHSRTIEHLTLQKGKRDRVSEDLIISQAIINMISKEILNRSTYDIALNPGDSSEKTNLRYLTEIKALLAGQIPSFIKEGNNHFEPNGKFTGLILPGSFNPLHQGHKSLLSKAHELTKKPGAYEISVKNVDKPDLQEKLISERLNQFGTSNTVLVTASPLFSQKSDLFPGSTFVIGYDTALRLIDPKYYDNDVRQMHKSISHIMANECDFLVAGRVHKERFLGLSSINIPIIFSEIFSEIPESEFRLDISSSEIRNRPGRELDVK